MNIQDYKHYGKTKCSGKFGIRLPSAITGAPSIPDMLMAPAG
jgi:hypothetical protein